MRYDLLELRELDEIYDQLSVELMLASSDSYDGLSEKNTKKSGVSLTCGTWQSQELLSELTGLQQKCQVKKGCKEMIREFC